MAHHPRTAWRAAMLALALCLGQFWLDSRALAAPAPTVAFDMPAEARLGERFTFSVTFDNASPVDTGYGPFVDLIVPITGADGAGAADDDGLTFVGATSLDQPLTATQLTFPDGASPTCVEHPLARTNSGAPLQVCGLPGDALVVIQLPFGSFTPSQPPAPVVVTAATSALADLNTSLGIQARGGFQYGQDALDNPVSDPSTIGSFAAASVLPALLGLKVAYIGPEDDVASGPSFPRQFRIDVDVPTGQTIANLDVIDLLPPELAFVRVISTTPPGAAPISLPTIGVAANAPENRLALRFASITGSSATDDASVTFEFFVPRADSLGAPVIDPATGDDLFSYNDARVEGDWQPIDARDPLTRAVSDATTSDIRILPKALALQKGVWPIVDAGAPGVSPGDTLEYNFQIQISDFFAFDNVVITDTLPDGQRFDSTWPPTLSVHGSGFTFAAAPMQGANVVAEPNYTPADSAPNDGSTRIIFRISDELLAQEEPSGALLGGCVPAGGAEDLPDCALYNDGPTTAIVVFRAVIQERYSDTFPSGDASVDLGDRLGNTVRIGGELLATDTLAPTGDDEVDDSGSLWVLPTGTLTASLYAVGGVQCDPQPCADRRIGPGSAVTFRARFAMPFSNVEALAFTSYLPLPVLHAGELAGFDALVSAVPPAAGRASFGPDDTFFALAGITPTLSADATSNSVTFSFGNYDRAASPASTLDLLFTVTASTEPFADGLALTNQIRAYSGSTNNGAQNRDAIVDLQMTQPVLRISKGAVAATNAAATFTPASVGPVDFTAPGGSCPAFSGVISSSGLDAAPVGSQVEGVDGSDRVTFALLVENIGSGLSGAHDVRLKDAIPDGFVLPPGGLTICVTDGAGTLLGYTDLGGRLMGDGIELDDPSASQGALAAYSASSGRNIAIVTYDLMLDPAVEAGAPLGDDGAGSLFNYGGAEGSTDHTPADLTDATTTTVQLPGVAAELLASEVASANNTVAQVSVGELATYRLHVTVPEGVTAGAVLSDTLPEGLAFVDFLGFDNSNPAHVTLSGATTPVVTGGGRTIRFNLGTITNLNADNTISETLSFTYRAVALDVAANARGATLQHSARFGWARGDTPTASGVGLTLLEPTLAIAQTASIDGGALGQAGDTVVYTITLRHAAASDADAFDATFEDALPRLSRSLILTPTFQVADSANAVGASLFELVGGDSAGWTLRTRPGASFDLPLDAARAITLTVEGTLANGLSAGQQVSNTATLRWTSLNGAPGQRSAYNAASTERGADEYAARASAALGMGAPDLGLSKSDGGATMLPGALVVYTLAYSNTGTRDATGVTVVETVPAHTTFDVASSSALWSCADGAAAGTTCTASIGRVARGASGALAFAVAVLDPLPAEATELLNSASIADDGVGGADTNAADNSSAQTTPLNEQAGEVSDLAAQAEVEQRTIVVRWETQVEIPSWRFVIWRSADGRREDAMLMTPIPIPRRGVGTGGASYSWTDTTVQPGVTYTYWVEAIGDDTAHEYGPIAALLPAPETINWLYFPLLREAAPFDPTYLPLIYTTYAVGVGGRRSLPQTSLFRPGAGPEKRKSWGPQAPKPPPGGRPRKSCYLPVS